MDFLPLIFFAAVAVFFAFRLYQVLGKRTGHTPEPRPAPAQDRAPAAEPAAAPRFAGPAGAGLTEIARHDPGFDPGVFLDGAKAAYGMIVEGFAKGDRDALRPLLSPKVFASYDKAIGDREKAGQAVTTEIERLAAAEIHGAGVQDGVAKVKVRFRADIATETRGKDGERIAGDLNRLTPVEEVWTFERPAASPDPNWVLSGVRPV
ncbi:MAG: Tim44 domain-containing protein [Maricaulaceae bacterium]|nr:Tim44 domain-containing protein [Maricaulaceae bacterium]